MAKGVLVFGEELRKIREQRFYTQDEFARALETGVRNLQRIESTFIAGIGLQPFRKLAELLKTSPEELRKRLQPTADQVKEWREGQGKGARQGLAANVREASMREIAGGTMDVPILNKIAAGPFVDERMREFPLVRGGDWVRVPGRGVKAFALWVEGESMEPKYSEGDLVVFRCVDPEREAVIDGRDYAIQLSGEHFYEQSFKRLYNHPRHGPAFLVAMPLNPKTKPRKIELRRSEISRLGIVWMVFPQQQ